MAKKKHTVEQIINKLCVELAPTTANLLLERGSTDVALLKSAQRRLLTQTRHSRLVDRDVAGFPLLPQRSR